MFETITEAQNRTFKEINKKHDMICIEEVKAITRCRTYPKSEYDKTDYWFNFIVGSEQIQSDYFDTEAEALKFRDEIMGWNNENT